MRIGTRCRQLERAGSYVHDVLIRAVVPVQGVGLVQPVQSVGPNGSIFGQLDGQPNCRRLALERRPGTVVARSDSVTTWPLDDGDRCVGPLVVEPDRGSIGMKVGVRSSWLCSCVRSSSWNRELSPLNRSRRRRSTHFNSSSVANRESSADRASGPFVHTIPDHRPTTTRARRAILSLSAPELLRKLPQSLGTGSSRTRLRARLYEGLRNFPWVR